MRERPDDHAGAVTIAAITGTAGVGKTALAVHWSHRAAERFPDGQLYLDLRGFDPSAQPVPASEAAGRLLQGLGVPPKDLPTEPDARFGLLRSLTAHQRLLVLLDNARDAEQIRPLLPAGTGTLVIATSRNELSSLVAVEGAHPIAVEALTPAESRRFLEHRLGPARTAESVALGKIVAACDGLPLALAVVAARAAGAPGFPLATFAAELADAQGSLDALAGDEPATDMRAVFSWSYRLLDHETAALFRSLSLHSGPDISVAAAASLAGVEPSRVRRQIAELVRAHLLSEHVPGRYVFHDLLRVYATELRARHDSESDQAEAVHRLLEHYLHSSFNADRLLVPARDAIDLPTPDAAVTPERPADREQAMDWFAAEHYTLLDALERAGDHGFDTHCWWLAWSMSGYLFLREHRRALAEVWEKAKAAAVRLGDASVLARCHRMLGYAYSRLGEHDRAHAELLGARRLYTELGDDLGLGRTFHELGRAYGHQEREADALAAHRRAAELFEAGGHRVDLGSALGSIGWFHARLGDYQEAIDCCHQVLPLLEEVDDHTGMAATWDSLGYAHRRLGQFDSATTCYQRSIRLHRDGDYRYGEATGLTHLGDTQAAAGDLDAARHSWKQALAILEDLDHPDANLVRTKLAES